MLTAYSGSVFTLGRPWEDHVQHEALNSVSCLQGGHPPLVLLLWIQERIFSLCTIHHALCFRLYFPKETNSWCLLTYPRSFCTNGSWLLWLNESRGQIILEVCCKVIREQLYHSLKKDEAQTLKFLWLIGHTLVWGTTFIFIHSSHSCHFHNGIRNDTIQKDKTVVWFYIMSLVECSKKDLILLLFIWGLYLAVLWESCCTRNWNWASCLQST